MYESFEAFQEALSIQQKSLQPGDKDLAETLNNICHLLHVTREEQLEQASVSTASTESSEE